MTWKIPAPDHCLDRQHIDVWRSDIDLSREKIEDYHATLSDDEKLRAEKFSFPDKFKEYVVTRGLLRNSLSHVLGRPPSSFIFSYTREKKPFLEENIEGQALSLNVSHSHGLAVVALSVGRRLGVDVEKIRSDVDLEKLAKRFFSKAEHEALMRFRGNRPRAFFSTWTRKEAFVKAVGKGISFGLGDFDVNIDPDEPPRMLSTRWDAGDAGIWHMATIETSEDYFASVVADGDKFDLRLWQAS